MIALMTTSDVIKLSAAKSLLTDAGLESVVFDAATGSLWRAIIPQRLMVSGSDLSRARWVLTSAGFVQANDGDWDYRQGGSQPSE